MLNKEVLTISSRALIFITYITQMALYVATQSSKNVRQKTLLQLCYITCIVTLLLQNCWYETLCELRYYAT
jgi:hypothetical protein